MISLWKLPKLKIKEENETNYKNINYNMILMGAQKGKMRKMEAIFDSSND